MIYNNIYKGIFLDRPNRFIAHVNVEGEKNNPQTVHVKNTGRCKELLPKGTKVFLEKSDKKERKTKYDLISVIKKDRIINMDSQAPNKVVKEWLEQNNLYKDTTFIKPEKTYKDSRFDFYIEGDGKKAWMEVKGVTLENDNVVSFPDAPTLRGLKHIEHLIMTKKEGYDAYIMFAIQMENVSYFTPNKDTQPEFVKALKRAEKAGVKILAYDCKVTEKELKINSQVPVKL